MLMLWAGAFQCVWGQPETCEGAAGAKTRPGKVALPDIHFKVYGLGVGVLGRSFA
jgi:hypothetical protein